MGGADEPVQRRMSAAMMGEIHATRDSSSEASPLGKMAPEQNLLVAREHRERGRGRLHVPAVDVGHGACRLVSKSRSSQAATAFARTSFMIDSACDDDATANLTDLAVAGNCTIPGKDVPGAFQMFADEGQAEISTSRPS